MTTARRERRGSALLGAIVGLAAGVLLAFLLVPDRNDEAVRDVGADVTAGSDTLAGDDVNEASGDSVQRAEAGPGSAAGADGAGSRRSAGAAAGRAGTPTGPAGVGAARGVTDNTITIGVALLDLGALRNLGPGFDNGDRRAHFEAILAGWKRDGLVPVHGRDVRFVYRSYGPIGPEEKRAACAGLMQDERVFAVIGDSQFDVGIDCVAREYRTPVLTSDAPISEATYERGAPFVFTLQMSSRRLLRNMVQWADRRGFLAGQQIGLYYADDTATRELMDQSVKAELTRLGHEVAAEHATTQTLGGPQDALAAQRFRTAGVDVAMVFTSKAGFMQQAKAQDYRPRYLESDLLSGTTNTATSTYPADQFDGTFAMTGMHYGEWKSGLPAPAAGQACVENHRRVSGRRIDPNEREAEYIALIKSCDDAAVVMRALQGSGRGLTHAGLVQQLEQVRAAPMGIHGDVTFGPGKHHGVDQQRTLQWSAGCACWRALGQFAPLFVP